MANTISLIPFSGTAEQEEKLRGFMQAHKEEKGALMPIMQQAQEIYGYLPIEVQRMIARELDISLEEVYGIATFYSQFSLNPKGKYKISVCLGTACYVKGAGDIFDKISASLGIKNGETSPDAMFTLEACRCIGACGLAPVLTVNEDVFGRLKSADVKNILKQYQR